MDLSGGIKINNSFILIGLLAIIVILAIIAVITLPIILNIIDNTTDVSINKYYVSELYNNNLKSNGYYIITEKGELLVGTNKYSWLFDYTGVGGSLGITGAFNCMEIGCNMGMGTDTTCWI